jgi:eukaryotic-like serine/threonine-protein kinase
MVDHVGQRFGDYRLKRLLSDRGAFADVYEGEHVVNRTKAAVKIWKVQIEAKTFLNDVRAAVLRHPHIVEILDFNIKGDVPYLVMAYAPNGSLQAQSLPLPLDSIVTYVQQIAGGLHYAHQRGIVHRDIKPDNILLGPQKEIWVGDFGIAIPSYTRQDTMPEEPEKRRTGTPAYMAPEQWEDQVSPASDQYALGVMVYEWLCGERPFRGNWVALYHKHTNEPPPPLRDKMPTISPAVEQVVMKTLEKYPEKRYASVEKFAQELDLAYQAERRASVSSSAVKMQPLGTLLYTYQVPRGYVHAFSWTLKGHHVALGDATGKIEVWDIATRMRTFANDSHTAAVKTILWSPDRESIASFAQEKGEMHIYNVNTGKVVATYAEREPIAWSPDGSRLAFTRSGSIRKRSSGRVEIWDVYSKSHVLTSTGHPISIHAVAWSPRGSHIASLGSNHIMQSIRSGRILVLQVCYADNGGMKAVCPFLSSPPSYLSSGDMIVWSPDGIHVAYYNRDPELSLEELSEKQYEEPEVHIWNIASERELMHYSSVQTLSWSPDSTKIAFVTHHKTVEIWNITSRNRLRTYSHHTQAVTAFSWSPNNLYIASASIDGTVEVWEADTGNTVLANKSPSSNVIEVSWSPDGHCVAARSNDNTVHVWQVVQSI